MESIAVSENNLIFTFIANVVFDPDIAKGNRKEIWSEKMHKLKFEVVSFGERICGCDGEIKKYTHLSTTVSQLSRGFYKR